MKIFKSTDMQGKEVYLIDPVHEDNEEEYTCLLYLTPELRTLENHVISEEELGKLILGYRATHPFIKLLFSETCKLIYF
jgi:hypothetical protein